MLATKRRGGRKKSTNTSGEKRKATTKSGKKGKGKRESESANPRGSKQRNIVKFYREKKGTIRPETCRGKKKRPDISSKAEGREKNPQKKKTPHPPPTR